MDLAPRVLGFVAERPLTPPLYAATESFFSLTTIAVFPSRRAALVKSPTIVPPCAVGRAVASRRFDALGRGLAAVAVPTLPTSNVVAISAAHRRRGWSEGVERMPCSSCRGLPRLMRRRRPSEHPGVGRNEGFVAQDNRFRSGRQLVGPDLRPIGTASPRASRVVAASKPRAT